MLSSFSAISTDGNWKPAFVEDKHKLCKR